MAKKEGMAPRKGSIHHGEAAALAKKLAAKKRPHSHH